MRIIVNGDPSLNETPLAGSTLLQQCLAALSPVSGTLPEVFQASQDVAGPLLWVEGLFPAIDASHLMALIESSQGDWFAAASNDDQSGLLYLKNGAPTSADLIAQHRETVTPVELAGLTAFQGPQQIGQATKACYQRQAQRLINDGVILLAPDLVWIEPEVTVEAGATIGPNVQLRGQTHIGADARIDMGSVITDVKIATRVHIRPYCVLESAEIGEDAAVGPFAHIRPGSKLGPECKIGNFVETKKAVLGKGSKASHLTYLGDARIGDDCNIGAGTITCNYDGFNKSLTQLGDGVFIGSNSQLVAPVALGDGAYVAAGSTVTSDVPSDALAIGRSRQVTKEGLAAKIRQKAKDRKEKARSEG